MTIRCLLPAICLALLLPPLATAQPAFGPARPESAAEPDLGLLRFGLDDRGSDSQLDSIVAVVDDDVITRSELNETMAAVAAQFRQRGAPLPPPGVLERQVLERLILTQLQVRAAERNGVVVDDATLNAALENMARQNNLTLGQLREAIERDGFSFEKFRENIRKEILSARLRQRVVDSRIQISDQEVDNLLASGAGAANDRQYHIAQILIAVPENASAEQIEQARRKAEQVLEQLRQGADFKRLAVSVSDGRQALEGGDLGWRSVNQMPSLFAAVVPRLDAGEVSEPIRSPGGFHILKVLETRGGGGQQTVIQTHARHILINTNELIDDSEARLRLERLRERIVNGEDFAELARANSSDATSAAEGGDLGWVNPGDLVPRFEEAMAELSPGQVSEPFKTRFGWHIVQVLERRRHDNSSEAQRAAAREALARRRSDEEWEQWLRQLRDESYVEMRLE